MRELVSRKRVIEPRPSQRKKNVRGAAPVIFIRVGPSAGVRLALEDCDLDADAVHERHEGDVEVGRAPPERHRVHGDDEHGVPARARTGEKRAREVFACRPVRERRIQIWIRVGWG